MGNYIAVFTICTACKCLWILPTGTKFGVQYLETIRAQESQMSWPSFHIDELSYSA